MSAAEAFQKAMAELKSETAASIQQHRADSKALAEMTGRLNAALQGQITDVDIAALAAEIHEAAVDLHNGISSDHTDAVGATTANAGTSHVQGGATAGPDVVSTSSIGTVVPEATPDASSQAVPSTLGGGAMPAEDPTIQEKAPGSPVPTKDGDDKPAEPLPPEEGDETPVAEPPVPSVEDVPSNVHDTAPGSAKAD